MGFIKINGVVYGASDANLISCTNNKNVKTTVQEVANDLYSTKVPKTTSVNGKALSSNITLAPKDISDKFIFSSADNLSDSVVEAGLQFQICSFSEYSSLTKKSNVLYLINSMD